MAVHARLRARNIGMSRHFHKAVAISAIHAQFRCVNLMGEGHGLNRLIAHPGVGGGEVIPDPGRD